MDDITLANMRLRIERCRRLARSCTDEETVQALLQMAEEGEADLARMSMDRETESDAQ